MENVFMTLEKKNGASFRPEKCFGGTRTSYHDEKGKLETKNMIIFTAFICWEQIKKIYKNFQETWDFPSEVGSEVRFLEAVVRKQIKTKYQAHLRKQSDG